MGEEKKLEKQMIAKESLKALNEIEETMKVENIVKDNKIEFKSGEKTFRVRIPTFVEQQEIDNARRKKYTELMDDDSYLFRKQWIKRYEKKGIDVNKMENNIRTIQGEIEKLFLRLAKVTNIKDIKTFKNDILKLRDEQYDLTIEKTDLLSYSIEDQLLIFVNSYTAYIVLERKDKDNWVKHFKTYEEFSNSNNNDLISKLFYYINYLVYAGGSYESGTAKKTG